jgi:hypothetical protein
MPSRYHDGWKAWSESRATYDRSYIHPVRWPVEINACASNGAGSEITDYAMRINGPNTPDRILHGRDCTRTLTVPRLGTYTITVTVRTADGGRATRIETATLRDHLIVSVGDSLASGEGVPDRRGRYEFGSRPSLKWLLLVPPNAQAADLGLHELRKVNWRDDRCHRSALGGHAQAAEEIERRDRHSSVTFVSLACTGATVADVRRQLDQIAPLVRGRGVDAILLSVGVNDVGFAQIITRCVLEPQPWEPGTDCVRNTGFRAKVERLPGNLDQLAAALARFAPAEIYLNEYPAAPFGDDDGSCGLLSSGPFGISGAEASEIHTAGWRLNWTLERAAARHRWNFVAGTTDRSLSHAYCEDDSYFVSVEQSLHRQGHWRGAVHPNVRGHAVLSELLTRAVVFDRLPLPHWRVTVTIDEVLLPAGTKPPRAVPTTPDGKPIPLPDTIELPLRVHLKVIQPGIAGGTFSRWLTVPAAGEWVTPTGETTYEIDLFDPPRPPRYATEIRHVLTVPDGTIGVAHGIGELFGQGHYEALHPSGSGVRYRVDVHRVQPGPVLEPAGQPVTTR